MGMGVAPGLRSKAAIIPECRQKVILIFLEIPLTFEIAVPNIAPMVIETPSAAAVLAELGNETRLAIVRNLVRAGGDGLTVGEIQRATGVPGSTLTHHIRRLCQVGLVSQTRRGSTLWCRADTDLVHSLAHYLIEECCAGEGGRREVDAA